MAWPVMNPKEDMTEGESAQWVIQTGLLVRQLNPQAIDISAVFTGGKQIIDFIRIRSQVEQLISIPP
jgi:hypothetical protein